jgi:hypothetical protein
LLTIDPQFHIFAFLKEREDLAQVNRVFCSKVCVVEFVEAQAANIAFSHESANFGCLFLAAFLQRQGACRQGEGEPRW